MGSEDEAEQSLCRPSRQATAGPSGHANSPHPSSREGHLSTAQWNSSVLLSKLILHGCHAAAAASSPVQRNSVPSTQMRCRITASLRQLFVVSTELLLLHAAFTWGSPSRSDGKTS